MSQIPARLLQGDQCLGLLVQCSVIGNINIIVYPSGFEHLQQRGYLVQPLRPRDVLRNLDEVRHRLQADADSKESQRCQCERVIARNVRDLSFGQIGALF